MDFTDFSDDDLDRFVTAVETAMGQGRVAQMAALREIDRRQTPMADGCRSLTEWVAGRLDLAPDTAKTLVATARNLSELPMIEEAAASRELSFDRIAAIARLAQAGDEADVLAESAVLDVAGIHRRVAHRRRMTRNQEHLAFRDRYLSLQPNLDESAWRLHGQLPGEAGSVVERALHEVGDDLPATPITRSRTTRNADALWQIAQDALDGDSVEGGEPSHGVTIFVDAKQAAATSGETGVTIESGPRVGPATLEAVVCSGAVEVTALADDGTPLSLGRRTAV